MGAGGDASLAEEGKVPRTAHFEDIPLNAVHETVGRAADGTRPAAAGKSKQLMSAVDPEKMLLVDFKAITAEVTNGTGAKPLIPKWLKGQRENPDKPSMRKILHSVTGCCLPGELLALMGPSGSGKTSLLSIIGGRLPKGVLMSGEVLYNGKKLNKRAKRQVGYVMQDDLLYESLTVYETLYFAALLRLPRTMSKEDKLVRVDAVITALGLDKCKNTIIGSYFRRGVSGGERKRVSVGHELLINPSLILLDEPTSGLDSTTALLLVESLRTLASGGRAIITTIHQPSSRLYQMLDKLMLLADGHVMYYGKALMAADWFHKLGFTLPYGTNVADFILDLASGAVLSDERNEADGKMYMIECSERFLSHGSVVVNGYKEGHDVTGALGLKSRGSLSLGTRPSLDGDLSPMKPSPFAAQDKSHTTFLEGNESEHLDLEEGGGHGVKAAGGPHTSNATLRRTLTKMDSSAAGKQGNRWGASYTTQLRVLFTRALKTRRFESLSIQDITQFVIIGFLCGFFWLNVGRQVTTVAGRTLSGLLFFELLFLAFRTMFAALFTFPNEYKMMLKERASGMYRLSAFYFARTASDLPMDCTIPSIFIFIIYFMSDLKRTPGAFFANWATVMLTQLVAQSFGLLIGATVMVPKTAQTITTVVMLGMMLVGGFYITNIAPWIAWLKYCSFIYYAYNILLKIQFSHDTLYSCPTVTPADPATSLLCVAVPPSGLQKAMNLPVSVTEWPWEALALIGFLFFFRTLVYVALRWKTRKA